jgi:hypothetical protein
MPPLIACSGSEETFSGLEVRPNFRRNQSVGFDTDDLV